MQVLKPMLSTWWAHFLGGVFLSLCFFSLAHASNLQLQDQKIKAGLLYNFLKYTSWPAHAFDGSATAFEICLVGGDALNGAMNPLQGRTAQMRTINIKRIDNADHLATCHLAFIHQSQESDLAELMAAAKEHSVLLISDIEEFSRKGGMVEFSNSEETRIHLYLNNPAIAEAGLVVGTQLTKLAKSR